MKNEIWGSRANWGSCFANYVMLQGLPVTSVLDFDHKLLSACRSCSLFGNGLRIIGPIEVLFGRRKQRRQFHHYVEPLLFPWLCFGNLLSLTLFTMADVPISPWLPFYVQETGTAPTLKSFCPCRQPLLLQAQGFLGPPWRVVPLLLLSRLRSSEPLLPQLNPICFVASRKSSHLPVY